MLRILLTLSLLFSVVTASAQMLDEAEREQKQAEMHQQMLEISGWLQDQAYASSSLIFAVTALSSRKQPVDHILNILTDSIDSKGLNKSDWHRLARFCQQAQRGAKFTNGEAPRKLAAGQFNSWCEKNRIFKQYFEIDSGNANVYLWQIDFSAADPYNQDNLDLLRKAATAEYATDYFGFGLHGLSTHLREYYRTHQVESLILPAEGALDSEDAFISVYSISAIATFIAYPSRILGFCSHSRRQEYPSFDEKVVADCLRLMKLFSSDKNTLMDIVTANTIISGLSQPGSDEQMEAERQKITTRLTVECLSTWGDSHGSEANFMSELGVFLKMQPLLESMGEIQAMAAGSDQYFAAFQNKDEPKPSSCLLLKDMDLEAAKKMQSVKN